MNHASEKVPGSRRFRVRPLHVVLFVAACMVFSVYWWASLTVGRTLFPPKAYSIGVYIPLDYDSVRSRSEDELRVKNAGVALKSRVETRLNENGFSRTASRGSSEIDLFTGTFQGSPQILLRLEDWNSVGEGGVFYRLTFDYTCQLPRSTLRHQEKMAKLIIEFDNSLESWMDDCHREFVNDHPEFR